MSDEPARFPPSDLASFLALCAGEWLALRSRFDLAAATAASNDGGAAAAAPEDLGGPPEEPWHQSERGELVVEHLPPAGPEQIGGLRLQPPGGGAPARLTFLADGRFQRDDGAEGQWCLWPGGTLELLLSAGGVERQERIWFTKANLRLRSALERRADGSPDQASFSSEIRRIARPPA